MFASCWAKSGVWASRRAFSIQASYAEGVRSFVGGGGCDNLRKWVNVRRLERGVAEVLAGVLEDDMVGSSAGDEDEGTSRCI